MVSLEKKVLGMLYGTAFGDALGAPIEHLSRTDIIEKYGGEVNNINIPWHMANRSAIDRNNRQCGFGIFTDDTLMTLALIRVYMKCQRHIDAYDMASLFVPEIAQYPVFLAEYGRNAILLERLYYPEKHIFLRHALSNCDPREGGHCNAVNCGSAMYISPIGAVNACRPHRAYEEAISFASGHQRSYGLEAAGVMAACVAKAFQPGVDESSIIQTAINVAKDGTRNAIIALCDLSERLRPISEDSSAVADEMNNEISKYCSSYKKNESPLFEQSILSNGYIPGRAFSIRELPIALAYLYLYPGEPVKAITKAVNTGGDCDSIGVMTGAIAGALYGDSVFDKKQIDQIIDVNQVDLIMIGSEFCEIIKQIIKQDQHLFLAEEKAIEELLNN